MLKPVGSELVKFHFHCHETRKYQVVLHGTEHHHGLDFQTYRLGSKYQERKNPTMQRFTTAAAYPKLLVSFSSEEPERRKISSACRTAA